MSDSIFDYISPEDVAEGLGEELQDTLRRLSKAQSMIVELEAEVSRLRSKIWQDHQDGVHCFCEDCLAYAESNNMEPVYNDDGDQWDYRKKKDSNGMG